MNQPKTAAFSTLLITVLLIFGCATVEYSDTDQAKSAISVKSWDTAYQFIEKGLASSNQSERQKGLELLAQHPALRDAAEKSFSVERVLQTFTAYGLQKAIVRERERLMILKTFAPAKMYLSAQENVLSAESAYRTQLTKMELENSMAITRKRNVELELINAQQSARFSCSDTANCEKAFALTQIFITENSDMKIQIATGTIIETYSPLKTGDVGIRAVKTPKLGSSADISLSLNCRSNALEESELRCKNKEAAIYRSFASYMKAGLLQ